MATFVRPTSTHYICNDLHLHIMATSLSCVQEVRPNLLWVHTSMAVSLPLHLTPSNHTVEGGVPKPDADIRDGESLKRRSVLSTGSDTRNVRRHNAEDLAFNVGYVDLLRKYINLGKIVTFCQSFVV